MSRPKGTKNKIWTKEEKLRIVLRNLDEHVGTRTLEIEEKIDRGMISRWVRTYLKYGEEGLANKKKTGNKFAALNTSKNLSELEQLRLTILKQEIEIERLKKGYIVKGVGANKEYDILNKKNMRYSTN